MKLKFGFNFNFASWRAKDRADLIFDGIIIVFFGAALFFIWEGSILYKESFQKRAPPTPITSEPDISSKDIDDVLQMVDERASKFNDILGLK